MLFRTGGERERRKPSSARALSSAGKPPQVGSHYPCRAGGARRRLSQLPAGPRLRRDSDSPRRHLQGRRSPGSWCRGPIPEHLLPDHPDQPVPGSSCRRSQPARRLGEPGRARITLPVPGTDLINVEAKAPTADEAAAIANDVTALLASTPEFMDQFLTDYHQPCLQQRVEATRSTLEDEQAQAREPRWPPALANLQIDSQEAMVDATRVPTNRCSRS